MRKLAAMALLLLAPLSAPAAHPTDAVPKPATLKHQVEREAQLQRSTATAIFDVELRLAEARLELAQQTCATGGSHQDCLTRAQRAHDSALDRALGRLQQSQTVASHLEASVALSGVGQNAS